MQAPPTDAKIAAGLLKKENVSDNAKSFEVEDKPVEWPNGNELLQDIKTLQRFSFFVDKGYTI